MNAMKTVQELENAVNQLPNEEYRRFRLWFLNRDWEKWDQQIEEDSENHRLDFLLDEAQKAKNEGTIRLL